MKQGKITWYDLQPYQDDPSLASAHPHHKRVPQTSNIIDGG